MNVNRWYIMCLLELQRRVGYTSRKQIGKTFIKIIPDALAVPLYILRRISTENTTTTQPADDLDQLFVDYSICIARRSYLFAILIRST
jgi:hypothetical protein